MYKQYGKDGQLVIFYRDIHIANFPLGKMKMRDYEYNANQLILNGMKDNLKIPEIIKSLRLFCEGIRYITWKNTKVKKYKRTKIKLEDYRLFICSLLALVKLEIVNVDDAYLIFSYETIKRHKYCSAKRRDRIRDRQHSDSSSSSFAPS